MVSKKDYYINKTYKNNKGLYFKIIDYINNTKVLIEFEDGCIIWVNTSNILKGNVKSLNYPLIYNKGYFGTGKYLAKINNKIEKSYNIWVAMLTRCYSLTYHKKQPTYIGCSVCEEWLNYQNFAKWFEDNYIENYALDKDSTIIGNKIYSPETCKFITQADNNRFQFKHLKKNQENWEIESEKINYYEQNY